MVDDVEPQEVEVRQDARGHPHGQKAGRAPPCFDVFGQQVTGWEMGDEHRLSMRQTAFRKRN
jgi:hypothetical protein